MAHQNIRFSIFSVALQQIALHALAVASHYAWQLVNGSKERLYVSTHPACFLTQHLECLRGCLLPDMGCSAALSEPCSRPSPAIIGN
jgi:hypothetical protein